jgi:hypothetical protein
MVHFKRSIRSQRVFSRNRGKKIVNLEVNGLVKAGIKFNYPVEGLKNVT